MRQPLKILLTISGIASLGLTIFFLRLPIEEGMMNQLMSQFAKAQEAQEWESSLKIADAAVFLAQGMQNKSLRLGQAYQLKGLAYRQRNDFENTKKYFNLSERAYLQLAKK